jgi:hypothetical protein
LKAAVVLAIVFAIAGGFVLIIPASTNFKVAAAQEGEEQQQQQSSNLNNTVSSSSSSSMTEDDSRTSLNSVTNNQTTFGEPLPSPTQSNATTLSGEIGSIQAAHQGTFSWSTAGEWG